MNIEYIISPSIIDEHFYARVYEASSPDAQVGEIFVSKPHDNPKSIVFNGLDKVTHIVRLFTASGSKLHEYSQESVENIVTIFTPIHFKIGDGGSNTPAVDTAVYINSDMVGLAPDDYKVHRNGYGFLFEGVHIQNDSGAGGFSFIDGSKFDPESEYVIFQNPKKITTVVNDSVVGKQWGPTTGNSNIYVDITAPLSYNPTHLRKLMRFAGNAGVYTFGVSDNIPIGYPFRFTHFGAYSAVTDKGVINFNNAPLIKGNSTVASVNVAVGFIYEFVFDGTSWNYTMICQSIYGAPISNQIIANGRYVVGDLLEGIWTVTHNLNINYPYRVIVTIYSRNNNHAFDNRVCFAVREYMPNSFKITAQEIAPEIQAIDFDWFIVKA